MIARIAEGDKEDVDLAVKAAREAFDHGPWPRMSGYVRTLTTTMFFSFVCFHLKPCLFEFDNYCFFKQFVL